MSLRGFGSLSDSVNSIPLIISPLYDSNSIPSIVSLSDDLGLANCPAILPTFTTGQDAPNVHTTAICQITLKLFLFFYKNIKSILV